MHELAHTLFYSRSSEVPWRYGAETPEEENFCDHLAASLLLPDRIVATCEVAADLVTLHRRYDVSLELAVRAWALVHRRHAAVFVWTDEARPRVQWATQIRARIVQEWARQLRTSTKTATPRNGTGHVVSGRQQAVFLAA